MGSRSAGTPDLENPTASAVAASAAGRTPFSESGQQSARTSCDALDTLVVDVDLRHLGHPFQHRDGKSLAREEDEAQAETDRGLDRLQPEAEGDPVRVRD